MRSSSVRPASSCALLARSASLAALGRAVVGTVLVALAACSSPNAKASNGAANDGAAPKGSGTPTQVRYVIYASGQRLGLVNESHSNRAEHYSETKKLSEAGTKVTSDEVLEAVVEYFDEQGLFKTAASGVAPATSVNGISQALEVSIGGSVRHVTIGRGTAVDDHQRFLICAKAFADVYNATYGLQSVDRSPDFEDQARSKKKSAVKN
jgi:hypothetical protein